MQQPIKTARGAFCQERGRVFFSALLLAVLLLAGCQQNEKNEGKLVQQPAGSGAQRLLLPETGCYPGAYIDFGEGEDNLTYDALTAFEKLTGKHHAIIAFSSFWGEQNFPAKLVNIVHAYEAIPLIYWSPWDKPYEEGHGPDQFTLRDIVAGKWDAYIDQWAEGAKAYGKPMLVAWGIEMNGTWFPWSGYFYNGGKKTEQGADPASFAGPELYKKAYRHVVDRVRAKKAENILWGFHANNFSEPRSEWNHMARYYPGAGYVDWLGLSVYGKMRRSEGWAAFFNMMDQPYQEICQLDPAKPVILAEWGVGEFPPGDKAGFISTALQQIKTRYTRVRAAVVWHERWENDDGSYSNLRVNSSPEALEAYRAGIADPYWIARPRFQSIPRQ